MKKLRAAVVSALFCLLLFASCHSSVPQYTVKGMVLSVSDASLIISTPGVSDFDKASVGVPSGTALKTSAGKNIELKDIKINDSVVVVYDGTIRESYPPQITARSITLQAASATETMQAEYRKISPEQAQEILKENQKTLIVDVRTQPEYEEQRLPQSILIPNEEIEALAPKLLADKQAVIFVYCRTGVRSKEAALKLVNLGYTSVYDIGGIVDWPYQTVSGK